MRYPSNKSLLTHKLAIYSCTSWPGDHDWFSHGGSYPRLFSTKLYGSDVWWKDNVTTTLESSVPKFSFWLGEPDNLTEFVKLPILEAINPFNIGTIITRTSSIECGMEKVKHREQNQFAVFCLLQLHWTSREDTTGEKLSVATAMYQTGAQQPPFRVWP